MINLSFTSQIREDVPERASKASLLGFLGDSKTVELALALEAGRSELCVFSVDNVIQY